MSLKSQIETAKDAVGKALITALENKDTNAISNLMNCYTSLNTITITEPFKLDLSKGIYTNNYESYNIPCSMSDDVISFTGLG
jgi:hypothetical protein